MTGDIVSPHVVGGGAARRGRNDRLSPED